MADASKDSGSREVLRHPIFEEKVLLTRIKNHFICMFHACLCYIKFLTCFLVSVESVGSMNAKDILSESLKVIVKKCNILKESLSTAGVVDA